MVSRQARARGEEQYTDQARAVEKGTDLTHLTGYMVTPQTVEGDC